MTNIQTVGLVKEEYLDVANFSSEGLDIGKDSKVLTYLHGLSDFWVYIFDDASKVNLLLEANAVTASDIYNRFLQLTSGISLEDISVLTNTQIKLVLISDESNVGVNAPTTGRVPGKVETYFIPTDTAIKYAKSLVNRAFMPTSNLENDADFHIDGNLSQISFAKPLANCGFPFRVLPSGAKQYAIWAVDAKIDDNMVYKHYAKLIGIDPATSTDLFKNFVYGMYYLFVNGPDIDTLRKGLNLTLGIPLSRGTETVLEIKKYLNTDQYIVVTDSNSYVVPYGLAPTVVVGGVLATGDEIATWVEVKDYQKDGSWWINFMIPANLMPNMPTSVPGSTGVVTAEATPNRYATAGSYADWLMRNYLKKHTFLVNIKTLSFKNIQVFEQLAHIINQVKPIHSTPIYVWTIPIEDDVLVFVDTMTLQYQKFKNENIISGMYRFTRDSTNPLPRNMPLYIRMSGPSKLDDLMGRSPAINGTTRGFNGGIVTGYIAPQSTISTLSDKDIAWNKAFRTRGQEQFVTTRGKIDFKRNSGSVLSGTITVNPFRVRYPNVRLVYLYTTTERDVAEKFAAAGLPVPAGYMFDLFKPTNAVDLINVHTIDGSFENNYSAFLTANFNYFFNKGQYGRFLSPLFPYESQKTFLPAVTDLTTGDYLVFSRIGDGGVGVFWATSNFILNTTPYFSHDVTDVLSMTISGKVTRGMAPHGSPCYMLRGAGSTISYNTSNEVNANPVNNALDPSTGLAVTYSDAYNPSFVRDRSGTGLVTTRVWK